ncbi:hypothetical protein [Bradyrhizobium sp. USDA 4508]
MISYGGFGSRLAVPSCPEGSHMTYVNLFDAKGQIDLSVVTEDVIAGLSAAQSAALEGLIEAKSHRDAVANKLAEAMASVQAALRTADEAQKAYIASAPPIDPIAAQRAVIRAQRIAAGLISEDDEPDPLKPTSHAKHAIKGPRIAHEKAQHDLAAARGIVEIAKRADAAAEKLLSAAVIEWIKVNPAPDQIDVARASMNRDSEVALARVKAGKPAVLPKPVVRHASALDAQAHARGRAGTRTSLISTVARRTV